MKDNKLEVGDVVYKRNGSFHSYLSKHTVERLTTKWAIISGGIKVLNELKSDYSKTSLEARLVGEYGYVTLENEDLKQQLREQGIRQKAKKAFNSIKLDQITIEQCLLLINHFTIPEPLNKES